MGGEVGGTKGRERGKGGEWGGRGETRWKEGKQENEDGKEEKIVRRKNKNKLKYI